MTEQLELTYVAHVKHTEEWLEALVADIEGQINATKEVEPSLEGATEALSTAEKSLKDIQSQRAELLNIRDTRLQTQDRKDDATRVIQECRRAEEVIKQWTAWLTFQNHRLSRMRDDNSTQETE